MDLLIKDNTKFLSAIFVDSEIDENVVYNDIQNKLGSLVILEEQDNWCFVDNTIYAINIKEINNLNKLINTIFNHNIQVFLIISVDIQKEIELETVTNLLQYLLYRSFKVHDNRLVVYSASFIYLLTKNCYIDINTLITDNTYITLKSRTEPVRNLINYRKYKEDSNNFYTRLLGIKYKYFNPNLKGIEYTAREIVTNDCTIRAMCAITDELYQKNYERLYLISFNRYTMTNKITNVVLTLKPYGNFKLYRVRKIKSVGELISKYSDIKMLISNGDHIVYEYEKVIYDNRIYSTDNFILSVPKFIITEAKVDTEFFKEVPEDKF